jgi:hypothetical protein
MGAQRQDGSVQSANLPAFSKLAKNKVDRDFGIYRCMVTRVNFTDEENNLTFENKQVTYEAVILGGPKEGQVIQNIKAMNEYGGEFNYAEKVYRPIETKNIKEKNIKDHKGDIVYVAFLQGNNRAPIIIGGGVQPFDKDSTGATKADGFRDRSEYNGVFEEINKSGEYELLRKGGTLDSTTGVFTPSVKDFEARFKFFANKMLWEDPNSSMLFEKTEQRFTLKVGPDGYTEVINGKDKTVVQSVGGVKVELNGKTNNVKITASSTVIEIDGATGKIKLSGDFVDLGKAVSDFVVMFTELSTAYNSHTHMVPQAPSGMLPSQPPIAPLLQTVGSTSVKVQP